MEKAMMELLPIVKAAKMTWSFRFNTKRNQSEKVRAFSLIIHGEKQTKASTRIDKNKQIKKTKKKK
uniref:Uncharacterized protein n=1 Tax=Rhizophora mucronata TaxID=61149 RepID=A0A2P2JW61_RHIMU